MSVLFDTNILIDYLNGVLLARTEVDSHENRAVSMMTWMEVMVGTNSGTEKDTRLFLGQFQVLPITLGVAERAVSLRQQHTIKLPDAIIWATAQIADRILLTRNSRDFSSAQSSVRIPYII